MYGYDRNNQLDDDRVIETLMDSAPENDPKRKTLKPAFKQKDFRTEKQAIKALKPKKKSLPAKVITIIVSCSAAFLVAVLVVTLCCVFLISPKVNYEFAFKNVHNFVALSIDPRNKAISLPGDDVTENVYYLYQRANSICKDADYLTVYNKGMVLTIVGATENYMNVDTVVMKTQDEYFKVEHRVKDVFPLADAPIVGKIFMSRGGVNSTRLYATHDSETAKKQLVTNANDVDEEGVPYADWSKATDSNVDKPVFENSQDGEFTLMLHTIRQDLIKDCYLELYKDEETKEEYYIMTFNLDVSNPEATTESRKEIVAGTGDKNTAFSEVVVGATVWKDGSFRTLTVTEKWQADFKVTQGDFEMQYNWHFSYDPEDCNIADYPDAQGFAVNK